MRQQLTRPSPLHAMFVVQPLLSPPFRHWQDLEGVVHWTGDNKREVVRVDPPGISFASHRMKLCDFEKVTGDVDSGDMSATCMRCLTYERERMQLHETADRR